MGLGDMNVISEKNTLQIPRPKLEQWLVLGVTVAPGARVTGERLWDGEESYVSGTVGPIYNVRYL